MLYLNWSESRSELYTEIWETATQISRCTDSRLRTGGDMTHPISLAIGMLATAAAILGVFVWPTPYEYYVTENMSCRPCGSIRSVEYIWKTNRFTGHTEQIIPPVERVIPYQEKGEEDE
jgi:hypothetical protein